MSDTTKTPAWLALDQAAHEHGCGEITLEESSDINRIWVWSAVYAICLFTAAFVPALWIDRRRMRIKEEKDAEREEKLQRKGSRVDNKPVTGAADDPKPNLPAAKDHLNRTSPTTLGENGEHKSYAIWATDSTDLTVIGGCGTALYFRLLKTLGYCFTYMAAVSCPIGAFSMFGTFATDTGQKMITTTIGNLGLMPTNGLSPFSRFLVVGCQGVTLPKVTQVFGWLDFWSITTFLGFIVYFRFIRIPKTQQKEDEENTTMADFSLQIDCLPRDLGEKHAAYEPKLKEHIENRIRAMREKVKREYPGDGKVCEISFVRDRRGTLNRCAKLAKVNQKIEIAEYKDDQKQKEKLEKKATKLMDKLKNSTGDKALGREVIRAYVVLNTSFDADNLLFDYRFSQWTILRCLQKDERRFEGNAIRVTRAPEPTDILWENQDVPFKKRLLRRVVVFVFFILLIVLSVTVVYGATVLSKSAGPNSFTYLNVEECDPTAGVSDSGTSTGSAECTVQEANKLNLTQAQAQGKLDCFCAAQGYEKILLNDQTRTACESYLTGLAKTSGITIGCSVVVMVINIVVKSVMALFAKVEQHLSKTDFYSSKMFKIFIGQYINTSMVILAVNWRAPESLLNIIPWPLFRGNFPYFSREWYAHVGAALLTTLACNVFVPAASHLFEMLMTIGKRRFKKNKMKHQAELLELYTNPEFDMAARYAALLNTVFSTLMWCSGMPLVLPFAAVFLFISYWVDKIQLLRASRQPPAFDTAMVRQASQCMFYAVAIHLVIAIFMLGQPCTLPSADIGGSMGSLLNQAHSETTSAASGAGESVQSGVFAKLHKYVVKETTWMLFLLLLLIIGLWCMWTVLWIVGSTFGSVVQVLAALCCRRSGSSSKVAPEEDATTFETVKEKLEVFCPPASYRLENNPDYEQIMKKVDEVEMELKAVSSNEAGPASLGQGAVGDSAQVAAPINSPGGSSTPAPSAESIAGPNLVVESVSEIELPPGPRLAADVGQQTGEGPVDQQTGEGPVGQQTGEGDV